MSRKKNPNGEARPRTIVVNLADEPELAQQIDQCMVSFGLDSRHQVVKAMLRAHCSAYPVDTMVFELARVAYNETRNAEYAALREFYEGRAKLFGAGTTS